MEVIFTDSLPHIREQIFGYLDPEDFLTCQLVCKSWKKMIDDSPTLWKYMSELIMEIFIGNCADKEHFQIVQNALDKADEEGIRKITRYLIWYEKATFRYMLFMNAKEAPSPLVRGVIETEMPKINEFLLSFYHNKNPSMKNCATILHFAAMRGNLEEVKVLTKYLEDKNPDVEMAMTTMTPFSAAVTFDQVEVVKYYIDNEFVTDEDIIDGLGGALELENPECLKLLFETVSKKKSKNSTRRKCAIL